jgi:formylglycine-generating enzyme
VAVRWMSAVAFAVVFAACTRPKTEPVGPTATAVAPIPEAEVEAGVSAAVEVDAGACPGAMVLVEGDYCPMPEHVCLRWMDPPGPYHDYRCAEYKHPVTCGAPRVKKRFCIDREEWVEPGEALPIAEQSWTSAGELCVARHARLCLESEWQFACEGPDMHPYPYGDGFTRDGKACNIDRSDLGAPGEGLRDLRAPIAEFPQCLSPFGVHDMSGNVEEWTTLDKGIAPQRSSMKGAWWLPGKNTCRAATTGHGEVYRGKQVGVRCCKDAA